MATVAQIKRAAHDAGFRGTNLAIAVAVALAESGGNEKAAHRNTNGSTDYGAWQINSVHSDLLSKGNPLSLQANANMAYSVYSSSGWNAWVTYKTGAYATKLTAAQKAKIATKTAKSVSTTVGSINPTTSTTSTFANYYGTDDPATSGDDHSSLLNTVGGVVPGIAAAEALGTNPVHDVNTLISTVSDPALWKRIGLGFLALLLVIIALVIMLNGSSRVRSIEKVAALA